MSKLPIKRRTRAPVTIDQRGDDIVDATRGDGSSFNFRFSSLEISSSGGKARVKSRQARFEGGKLTTQSFEGDFDRGVYDQWLQQTQRAVAGQASLLLKSLAWFLPFSRKPPGHRD